MELPLLDTQTDFWVFDKPADFSTPKGRDIGALGPGARLVHRLDRDTTGVWVVARTPRGARMWSEAFAARRVDKTYWALTLQVPASLHVQVPISEQPHRPRSRRGHATGLDAETHFRVLEQVEGLVWVEARPRTGRTHQIRVHLAEARAPIFGDLRYGGVMAARVGRQVRRAARALLHARQLRLPGVGTWSAPIPSDFREVAPEFSFAVTSRSE